MDYRIACEYRDVLLRSEHVAASLLTRDGILALLDRIEALAEVVQINFRHRPLSRDPNDDLVLDLAINGRADVIVTRNLRHIATPARDWGIRTLEPDKFLATIRK